MKTFKDKDTLITSNIFECSCHDFSHTFKIEVMNEGTDNEEFFIEVGLDETANLWRRIKLSLDYIWTGRSCKWDRIMKRKDIIRLQKQLEAHFGSKSNRKVRK